MKLADIEKVRELEEALRRANSTLRTFEMVQGDTVQVFARADEFRNAWAELLPVPKEVAVSAARRAVSKVIAQLAELGVEVQDHA
jgi:hypothetical protein